MKSLQLITLVLSLTSFLFPLIIGFKNRNTLLWRYLLIGFIFDVAIIIAKRVFHLQVIPLANIYYLIEFVLLSIYYYHYIAKEKIAFILVITSIAIFFIARVIINGVGEINGLGSALFALTYLTYSLMGLYKIAKEQNVEHIVRSTFFTVNIAVLLGFSGKFLMFFFEDYLKVHQYAALPVLWLFYKMLNVVVNVLFAVALSNKNDE